MRIQHLSDLLSYAGGYRSAASWRGVDPKNFRLRRPFCEGVDPLDPRLREILAWWGGGGEIFQKPRFHRSTHWFFTRKNQRGQPTKTKTNDLHWLLNTLFISESRMLPAGVAWILSIDFPYHSQFLKFCVTTVKMCCIEFLY